MTTEDGAQPPINPNKGATLHRRLTAVSRPSSAASTAAPPTRADAAADALASVRAEGLDPGRAEALLAAWVRGELTDTQLEQASVKLLHDRALTVEELLASSRAA